jgi:hypothetical protein
MARVVDRAALWEKIEYTPHSGQRPFHQSQARFKVMCAGRRMGKSISSPRDRLEPEMFIPDRRFWIVGPTYDLGEKEFRTVWNDLIIKLALGRDKRVKKSYNKRTGDMYIELPWQSRVEVRSADHPENLVGESLHGVILSEAAKHKVDTWERYLRAALADFHGWAHFPSTPEGFNWYYNLWQLGQDPAFPDYESWKLPSWLNPHVYPGGRDDPEINLLERTTTTEWFLQEIAADFASFVGKIYPEFDESKHVKPLKFNPAWKNYVFFDWGYVNPLAALDVQVDPWDNVYIWREHYKPYQRLEEHLAEMKAREQPDGYHVNLCFGDAEDPEATLEVSTKFAPCISSPDAKTNWRAGIDRVKFFLKLLQTGVMDEYDTPKTEPKLFIDHSCRNTIREFNNYRAPDPSRSGINPREIAKKSDDHAMDAIRYGLVHLYDLGLDTHLTDVVESELVDRDITVESLEAGFFTSRTEF